MEKLITSQWLQNDKGYDDNILTAFEDLHN